MWAGLTTTNCYSLSTGLPLDLGVFSRNEIRLVRWSDENGCLAGLIGDYFDLSCGCALSSKHLDDSNIIKIVLSCISEEVNA